MIGFKTDEVMVGTHRFEEGAGPPGEFPLHFSLTWGNSNLRKFLNPFSDQFLFNQARGVITVGSLAHKARCEGSLHLKYFSGRTIRYELEFTGDDGRPFRYVGEKRNIWPWNLHKTHVTCYGTVVERDSGRQVSSSIVYFPYREMAAFVLQTRLRFNSIYRYDN